MTAQPGSSRDVFIIHGRNEAATEAVEEFVKACGFEPKRFKSVTTTGLVRVQARPNVLFEIGMILGMGGVHRTIVATVGMDVEGLSNLKGTHAIRLDQREGPGELLRALETICGESPSSSPLSGKNPFEGLVRTSGFAEFDSFFRVRGRPVTLVHADRQLREEVLPWQALRTHYLHDEKGDLRRERRDLLDEKNLPSPEGIQAWLAFSDVRAAAALTNTVRTMSGVGIEFALDSDVDDDNFLNCRISLGLGFNAFTHRIAGLAPNLFGVDWGPSRKDATLYTDNISIGGSPLSAPPKGLDDCIVARVVSRRARQLRVSFVCAGRTAPGTAVAGEFLANHWMRMYELYDGHELERESLVVHLRHQAVDSSSRERALPEPELVQHRFAP